MDDRQDEKDYVQSISSSTPHGLLRRVSAGSNEGYLQELQPQLQLLRQWLPQPNTSHLYLVSHSWQLVALVEFIYWLQSFWQLLLLLFFCCLFLDLYHLYRYFQLLYFHSNLPYISQVQLDHRANWPRTCCIGLQLYCPANLERRVVCNRDIPELGKTFWQNS